MAVEKCGKWGYDHAEAFGAVRTICTQVGGFGNCVQGNKTIEFQCIGEL